MMNTTTASAAPTANAIRQPHASSAASPSHACSTSSSASATNCPAISVTYWKLDQKPRRACPAISLK